MDAVAHKRAGVGVRGAADRVRPGLVGVRVEHPPEGGDPTPARRGERLMISTAMGQPYWVGGGSTGSNLRSVGLTGRVQRRRFGPRIPARRGGSGRVGSGHVQ
jgi:hypothetical protein